jgi:hypothetical protein
VLVCFFSYSMEDEPKGSYYTVSGGVADNIFNVPIVPAEFFALFPAPSEDPSNGLIEQVNPITATPSLRSLVAM